MALAREERRGVALDGQQLVAVPTQWAEGREGAMGLAGFPFSASNIEQPWLQRRGP